VEKGPTPRWETLGKLKKGIGGHSKRRGPPKRSPGIQFPQNGVIQTQAPFKPKVYPQKPFKEKARPKKALKIIPRPPLKYPPLNLFGDP